MDSSYTYEPPTVDSAMTTAASASTGDINYEYSGAGAYTLDLMMTVVMVSYAFLFSVMLYSCMCTRHPAGFVQFDPEVPAPPKTGVVAELDQMWRKAFISKVCEDGWRQKQKSPAPCLSPAPPLPLPIQVYGIMSAQLFITFAISCSMMKFGGRDLIMWVSRDGDTISTPRSTPPLPRYIYCRCPRRVFNPLICFPCQRLPSAVSTHQAPPACRLVDFHHFHRPHDHDSNRIDVQPEKIPLQPHSPLGARPARSTLLAPPRRRPAPASHPPFPYAPAEPKPGRPQVFTVTMSFMVGLTCTPLPSARALSPRLPPE